MLLLNPNNYTREYPDKASLEIMLNTIRFFEDKGLKAIKNDDQERVWYQDFLDFVKNEQIFSQLLTPAANGDSGARWDMWRIQGFNEILGFYGLPYWYTWQVTILGLGPIWMSGNEDAKQKAANFLREGGIFAFGLSEKEHGADVYSSEMTLVPQSDGTFLANGSKYYIGNANAAAMVSTFGKIQGTTDYVFFVAETNKPGYEVVKNTVNSQNFVAEYKLENYKVTENDILSRGEKAWFDALNTVNVGKYNLGWASIGMCTHGLYEAINHASSRRLYNMYVTDFPHVKNMFVDAYARLVAMKLYAMRTADYMRSASLTDRRYLLYDPLVKMKVTTQGEEVVDLMWDVIAAKGFEKDTFFEMLTRDIRALPKLEGTVHVNIALIVKFVQNFLFVPAAFDEVPMRNDIADDTFLFNQGPTHGLSKIQFHDFHAALNLYETPNLKIFKEQVEVFRGMLVKTKTSQEQQKDTDMMLALGNIFTLVPYAQLILECAKYYKLENELVDQIFDFMVRDFSKYALQLYSKNLTSPEQQQFCLSMIRKSVFDEKRYMHIWNEHVLALKGQYVMNP